MRTEAQIALKERVNELKAKQRKLQIWEGQRALEIKHLILMQRWLQEDIDKLEKEISL